MRRERTKRNNCRRAHSRSSSAKLQHPLDLSLPYLLVNANKTKNIYLSNTRYPFIGTTFPHLTHSHYLVKKIILYFLLIFYRALNFMALNAYPRSNFRCHWKGFSLHPSYAIGDGQAHASVTDDIVSVEKNFTENKRKRSVMYVGGNRRGFATRGCV